MGNGNLAGRMALKCHNGSTSSHCNYPHSRFKPISSNSLQHLLLLPFPLLHRLSDFLGLIPTQMPPLNYSRRVKGAILCTFLSSSASFTMLQCWMADWKRKALMAMIKTTNLSSHTYFPVKRSQKSHSVSVYSSSSDFTIVLLKNS